MGKIQLLFAAFLFSYSQVIVAQPGSLDASFGTGGKVLNNFGFQNFNISSTAIQADGKTIVAGETSQPGTSNIFLVRFNTNGTLDNTFDGDGIVLTDVNSNSDDFLAKVIVLSTGNILVGGYYNIPGSSTDVTFLMRYSSNGSLDNTFDTDGKVFLNIANFSGVSDMLLQADNKIILVGDLGNDYGLVRTSAAGVLDNTFGTNGVAAADFGLDPFSALAAALQADGKIIVTGTIDITATEEVQFATVRYNTNGTVDNTFGTSGLVVTDVGSFDDTPNSITVLSSGNIVIAGTGSEQSGFIDGIDYSSVVRYTGNGSLDNTFNTNGIRTISTSGNYIFFGGHVVQSDGKIILSGAFKNASANYDFAAVRLNTNGSIDAGFDGDGYAVLAASPNEEVGFEILLQADGKPVLAGYSSSQGRFSAATARFNSNGSVDLTYDTDGLASTVIGGTPGTVNNGSVGVQNIVEANGKITSVGNYQNGAFNSIVLSRYNGNGTVDNTFGAGGYTLYILPFEAIVNAAVIQTDGKILVAVSFFDFVQGGQLGLLRFNSNGTLDNTFAASGRLIFQVNASNGERINSMLLQPDGKILVSGVSIDLSIFSGDLFIKRFNADGTPDNIFGTSSVAIASGFDFFSELGDFSTTQRMVLQPDGKIILTGTATDLFAFDFGVTRFNANGTPDATFNSGNVATIDFGSEDFGFAVALQPDGKIVVTGQAQTDPTTNKISIARLNSNGSLDNTFDGDGKVILSLGGKTAANCIAIQNDGKILLGGVNGAASGSSYITVARVNSNGALDNTFGTSGSVFLDVPDVRIDNPNSMVLQSDGKILLTGINQQNYAVIRLNNDVTTSVRNINSPLFKMKFTPNPFADALLLSATDISNGKYDLRVLNTEGKVLAVKSFNVTGRQIQLPIEASGWPKGVILIEIVNNTERRTFTLIRQ